LSKWDGLSVNHYLTGALAFFEREVRILNNAKRIAERVDDRANENPVPDILHRLMLSCSLFCKSLPCCMSIGDSPICFRTCGTWCGVGIEAQFKSPHVKANVKWLVKVGLNAKRRAVPVCWLHESSAQKREGLISSVTSSFDASQASKAKS